jgi:hypothetical protein
MTSNPKLATVRALLDKAEASTFPDEAATYRAKAEELMVKYRIEEEQLIASDPVSMKPLWGDTPVVRYDSPFVNNYHHLFHYIATHCGVLYEAQWGRDSNGERMLFARTVGYESDLRYAEALFTAARMVFADKLEPTINRSLPEEDNIYRLRAAGIERVRIADMVWGMGSRNDKRLLSKVGRVYAAECKRRGEEPMVAGRGVNGAAYREQYAEQFVSTLRGRLYQARADVAKSGGLPELHGRKERIQEAMYERFPYLRPKPAVEGSGEGKAVAQRCEKCQKAKSGWCRDHRPSYSRGTAGRDPYSAAAERGRAAGAAAARHVDLGPGGRKSVGG